VASRFRKNQRTLPAGFRPRETQKGKNPISRRKAKNQPGVRIKILSGNGITSVFKRKLLQISEKPDPIEAIKYRMEQMNLRQTDIAPLFGGKTRVSEVLHRKRPLTLRMIVLLNRYLGIPLESLISGNKDIKLAPEKRKKLLNVSAIRTQFSNGNRIATT